MGMAFNRKKQVFRLVLLSYFWYKVKHFYIRWGLGEETYSNHVVEINKETFCRYVDVKMGIDFYKVCSSEYFMVGELFWLLSIFFRL